MHTNFPYQYANHKEPPPNLILSKMRYFNFMRCGDKDRTENSMWTCCRVRGGQRPTITIYSEEGSSQLFKRSIHNVFPPHVSLLILPPPYNNVCWLHCQMKVVWKGKGGCLHKGMVFEWNRCLGTDWWRRLRKQIALWFFFFLANVLGSCFFYHHTVSSVLFWFFTKCHYAARQIWHHSDATSCVLFFRHSLYSHMNYDLKYLHCFCTTHFAFNHTKPPFSCL